MKLGSYDVWILSFDFSSYLCPFISSYRTVSDSFAARRAMILN